MLTIIITINFSLGNHMISSAIWNEQALLLTQNNEFQTFSSPSDFHYLPP